MVTNLPERAKAKWAEAQQARDPVTKLRLLKEFYSMFPKHKGTERLQVSLKRQIARLEEEVERARAKRAGRSRLEWVVKKEGLLQLALVGRLQVVVPLFNHLTSLQVEGYEPLHRPVVGVFEGAAVQFQLVLAPYEQGLSEHRLNRYMNLCRAADGVVVALGPEGRTYLQEVIAWFEEHNIEVRVPSLPVEVTPTPTGGIRIVGSSKKLDERAVVDYLKGFQVRSAVVRVREGATLDDLEAALFGRVTKRTLFLALGRRVADEVAGLAPNLIVLEPSTTRDSLALSLLQGLSKIRVFTKPIDRPPEERPLLLDDGATIRDVAQTIHRELAARFRYARVWRGAQTGIRVGASFPVQDGDIVEIHSA
jgi:hypothetical protein